jgi:hypothetical protein
MYVCMYVCTFTRRSQRPHGLRLESESLRLMRLWVRIPPGAWMSVSYECCVLSGRGICVGLITRPEECGVSECDLRISIIRRPWPTGGGGLLGHGKKIRIYTNCFLTYSVLRIYCIDRNFNGSEGTDSCLL